MVDLSSVAVAGRASPGRRHRGASVGVGRACELNNGVDGTSTRTSIDRWSAPVVVRIGKLNGGVLRATVLTGTVAVLLYAGRLDRAAARQARSDA